jgi:hypothetical protein
VTKRLSGIVLTLTVLAEGAGAVQSGSEWPPYVVAVYDGTTLLPVARYEGGRWLNTWPEPEDDSVPVPSLDQVPKQWLGRPVPTEWTLWFTTGGSAPLTVTGTERSGGCVVSPKLSIQHAPEEPRDLFDIVHPGVGTTDRVPVEALRRMRPSDAQWRQLQARIEALFKANEGRALHDWSDYGDVRQRPYAADVTRVKITVDWLYRGVGTSSDTYYFEANKRMQDSGSVLRIGVSGWLRYDRARGLLSVGVTARPAWDEAGPKSEISNVSDRIPLGILRTGAKTIWIMEVPSGESGRFVLYEVGQEARELLVTDAGGC